MQAKTRPEILLLFKPAIQEPGANWKLLVVDRPRLISIVLVGALWEAASLGA